MLVYNIGISGIQANQAALQTISNNIANANTDGYHRQRANLVQNRPIMQNDLQFGTGVTAQSVDRVINSVADNALTLNLSQSADSQAKLDVLQRIEGALNPTSGSLTSSVSDYFNSVENLATNPSDGTLRRGVVAAAQAIAQQITSFNSSLDQLQQQQVSKAQDTVKQINSLTSQIAGLNHQIHQLNAAGTQPATLLDQRDSLVQKLGQLVDLSPGSLSNPQSDLVAAGGWLVVGDRPQQLSVSRGEHGELQINVGSRGPVKPASGKLAGILAAHNEIIPKVRATVQEWSGTFVSAVNTVQATGLSLEGPASFVNGTNTVADPTVPLSQTKSLFPVKAGDLYVSVTNNSTGVRETTRVGIDPTQDSLQDVVGKIDALANVQASASPSGQVNIVADTGYSIDFAGRPGTSIDTSSVSGTAAPQTSGIYTGSTNSNWTVTADQSGEVGATSGLTLRVTDSATGSLVKEINVGSGYPANQPIEIADGLSIQLGAGTLVAGDHFNIAAISNPDTAGFLNAMGIGGLFHTDDLRTVSVHSNIAQNPSMIATSRNGNSGDASQLDRISQLRKTQVFSAGSETIEDRLASITSNSGADVNFEQTINDQLKSQENQLRDQQSAISGVDPNEELLSMLQFQRSFQANAKFISTVNNALDDLLQIIR